MFLFFLLNLCLLFIFPHPLLQLSLATFFCCISVPMNILKMILPSNHIFFLCSELCFYHPLELFDLSNFCKVIYKIGFDLYNWLTEWSKKEGPTTCCLQENHLASKDIHWLKWKEWELMHHANGAWKQEGVTALISNKTDIIRHCRNLAEIWDYFKNLRFNKLKNLKEIDMCLDTDLQNWTKWIEKT